MHRRQVFGGSDARRGVAAAFAGPDARCSAVARRKRSSRVAANALMLEQPGLLDPSTSMFDAKLLQLKAVFRCYGSAPAQRAPRAAGPGPQSRSPRPRRSVRGPRCARGSPRRSVDGSGAGRAAAPWRVLGRGLRRHCGGARMLRHPFRRLRRSGSRVGARGGPDAADFFLGILTNARTCSGVTLWLAGACAALLSSHGPVRHLGRRRGVAL